MIVDLVRLNNGLEKEAKFIFNFDYEDMVLDKKNQVNLDKIEVIGSVVKNNHDQYDIFLSINGIMRLPCAITLNMINYPFEIEIEGNLEEISKEIDGFVKKDQNTIDIFPIIWENILMEIPMKVVSDESENIKLKGDGWQLITDDEDKNKVNQEFEKLKDLL